MSSHESEDILGLAEEAPPQQLVPVASPTAPKASRGRGSSASAAEAEVCFLCGEELDTLFGSVVQWRGHKYDGYCGAACKCHWRLLQGDAEKESDDLYKTEHPEEWKQCIRPLVAHGQKRNISAVKNHRDRLTHLTKFQETAETDLDYLLTKPRFKSFMKRQEEYNTDSASESFDRRCDESASSHRDKRDRPRVRVDGNTEISSKRGHRTEEGSARRRSSPREELQRQQSAQRGRRRDRNVDGGRAGRSRSRRRGDRGKSSRPGRKKSAEKRLAANSSSLPSVRSPGAGRSRASANGAGEGEVASSSSQKQGNAEERRKESHKGKC